VAGTVGFHALSIAVIGSYISFFADGNIRAVAEFDLDSVTGEDPRAAKLARILAFYAQRLPVEERELLARLSVFPRGVSLDLLRSLVDAGGDVAGLLGAAKYKLSALLGRLRQRGLVFRYKSEGLLGDKITWSAHPFLRDRFRELLGCPSEAVFSVIADSLRANLEDKPGRKLSDPGELDRFEQYIEAERLAGRPNIGFTMYWRFLGNYEYLGISLGEFERGYRMLSAFRPGSQIANPKHALSLDRRLLIANDLGLYALRLGRTAEAKSIREFVDTSGIGAGHYPDKEASISLQNSSEVAFSRGHLNQAHSFADRAFKIAVRIRDFFEMRDSLCFRATAAHARGNIPAARKDFRAAEKYHRRSGSTMPLSSLRGAQKARHLLDIGDIEGARTLSSKSLEESLAAKSKLTAESSATRYELPLFHAILARIALAEDSDPSFHLKEIRRWSDRTGDQEFNITSHLLTAQHLLKLGDKKAAIADAIEGLSHAERCEFGLLQIELLVTLSWIYLASEEPPSAIQAARRAARQASSSDCGYDWGEAEAAKALGHAYFANNEQDQSHHAFKRMEALRRRIGFPTMSSLNGWLRTFK
jgi:tetratricopeptide (TPR) repeat protein